MSLDPSRPPPVPDERRTRWLSWLTLAAGAVMCVVAVLMS